MVSNAQKTLGGTGQGPDAEGAIETSFGGRTISEEIPDFAAPPRDGCACSTVCGACMGNYTQRNLPPQAAIFGPFRPIPAPPSWILRLPGPRVGPPGRLTARPRSSPAP